MQSEIKQLNVMIGALILLGGFLFIYKYVILDVALSTKTVKTNWTLEAKVLFNGKNAPAKIRLSIPQTQPYFLIVNENFVSPDYGVSTVTHHGNRTVIWTKRNAKKRERLYYRMTIKPRKHFAKVDYNISIHDIQLQKLSDNQTQAMNNIIKQAQEKSSDTASFVTQVLKILNQKANTNAESLLNNDRSNTNIVRIAQQLLHQANILSLPIQGVFLRKKPELTITPWLMVKQDKKWFYFNPSTGEESLSRNYLIWHLGLSPLYHTQGGQSANFSFTYRSQMQPVQNVSNNNGEKSKLLIFALSTLPMTLQHMLTILLTIPIGALIILIFRNYIGIKTFGTFMPILIALAFINMDFLWGMFLFVLVLTFGLLIRFYLDKLYLLSVPRLASVLVSVILFITFLTVIFYKSGLEDGASAALFPLVILTMTIEKMCNLWDDKGPKESISTCIGSLLVATISFLLMRIPALQFILFQFPELNLVVLAFILLLGQYHGYRLTELKRFQSLLNTYK